MPYGGEQTLGAALRSLRRSRNLSLSEAAARAGASKAALGAWEAGTRQPRGPALARLLTALGADDRTKARLLTLADPQHARIVLADSPFALSVDIGMVLRAMRERRGATQADLARKLGVSQATVSRWEAGDDAPSTETLHALGFALGAAAEETLALASAAGHGGGGLPDAPEAAPSRMRPYNTPYPLWEAMFLGWEAELTRRAARDPRWDAALVLALAHRSSWLAEEERYGEIAPVARRAIALATTPEARYHAVPALAALADADRRLGRGHASAAELAGAWASRLPDSQFRAWMIRQRGMSLVRMGRTSEGLTLVERSAHLDVEAASHFLEPWPHVTSTVCDALLEAGEPKRAVALIGGRRDRKFHPLTLVRVGHAIGQAATGAEMAYLRRWMNVEASTPLYRRRWERIKRRQARLTGKVIGPEATPDEAATEDQLWNAVLREHRG